MEIELTQQNFDDEVLSAKLPVLVDFWAPWCMPCQIVGPAVADIAKEYSGKLKVGKLNVDDHPDVASTYQVSGIPNLKIFVNGQIVHELVGALPKDEIRKQLDKFLKK